MGFALKSKPRLETPPCMSAILTLGPLLTELGTNAESATKMSKIAAVINVLLAEIAAIKKATSTTPPIL